MKQDLKQLILARIGKDAILRIAKNYGRDFRRKGSEYAVCCPWHDDTNPSLAVNPDKGETGLFYCNACGEGSDLFAFVMQECNLSFVGALELVAKELGIDIQPGPVGRAQYTYSDEEAAQRTREYEQRKARRLEYERKKAARIAQTARDVWERSEAGHERIGAYFRARGINLATLPANTASCVRYCPDAPDEYDPEARAYTTFAPALVYKLLQPGDGQLETIQLVYLDEHEPRKRSQGVARKYIGAKAGRHITIGSPRDAEMVVIGEGFETTASVVQAMSSTCKKVAGIVMCDANMDALDLSVLESDADPRIVLAGDLDRSRTGRNRMMGWWKDGRGEDEFRPGLLQRITERFPNRQPPVPVFPSSACHSDLVWAPAGEDEPREGKTVDWNDVLVTFGPSGVRDGITDAIDALNGGSGHGADGQGFGRGEGDRRPWIVDDPLVIARRFLREHCKLKGGRRFRLARWAGEWWWYEHGRWAKRSEERVRSMVWHWLQAFDKPAPTKTDPDRKVRFKPRKDAIKGVIEALCVDTHVVAERLPTIVPELIDARGVERFGAIATLDEPGPKQRDKHSAKESSVLVYENGVVDIAKAAQSGAVKLANHGLRIFNTSCLPYELDEKVATALLEAQNQGDLREVRSVYDKHCPNWMRFLDSISGADATDEDDVPHDPDMVDTLHLACGETLDSDRSLHYVYGLIAPPRAGKGIIQIAHEVAMGQESIASISAKRLIDDSSSIAALVGKRCLHIPDMRVGRNQDVTGFIEMTLSLAANDLMSFRDIYQPLQQCRLGVRPWWFGNRVPSELRDEATALGSRMVFIPLHRTFVGREDRDLGKRIRGEATGIGLWMLMGAIRLRQMDQRVIQTTQAGQDMAKWFNDASAPEQAFVRDCCVVDRKARITHKELHNAYTRWCEDEGDVRHPVGQRELVVRICSAVAGLRSTQPKVEGQRPRMVEGLQLKNTLVMQGYASEQEPQPPLGW